MPILCIDTSLDVCSVALAIKGADSIPHLEEKGFNIHSSRLTLMIEYLVHNAGIGLDEIDAICIDKGPGSYTGLRIGVSTAKGLCFALDKPLLSINTLETMAQYARDQLERTDNLLLCPMIDARRMEVYFSIFDMDIKYVLETEAKVVDDNFMADILDKSKVLFFGNGMTKCRDLLSKNPNAMFLDTDIYPRADYMKHKALEKFYSNEFEDIYSFEPYYLKDFMTAEMIKNQLINI